MKSILVTGATSGFGRGLVVSLLKKGHKVYATGRSLSSRKDIFSAERERYPNTLVELDLDVTNNDQLIKILDSLKDSDLDVLINNAGFAVFGPAEICSEEQLRRQFDVNFFAVVKLTNLLLPKLRKSRGQIINFSSLFGLIGFPLSSAYCASKYALEGFSEALSIELKPFDISVSLVEPGGFRTQFMKNSEWGMSQNISDSIYNNQIANYKKMRERMAQKTNPPDPQVVIDGVVKIVESRNPKISYVYGKDAQSIRFLKKILPRSIFHSLTKSALSKSFTKENR